MVKESSVAGEVLAAVHPDERSAGASAVVVQRMLKFLRVIICMCPLDGAGFILFSGCMIAEMRMWGY